MLSFLSGVDLHNTIRKIKNSLNKDGVFIGTFFGVNDDFNKYRRMSLVNKKVLKVLLDGLRIEKIDENEYDGKSGIGRDKHIHIFLVIARK